MAVWTPGMPWPSGTTGGASSPAWGGYTRLWVLAAIGSGNNFRMGTHQFDRLDAGNVMSGGGVIPAPGGSLWVDLSCDVLNLEIAGGASSAQGIFSKPDAGTLTVTLADPNGDLDPLNPNTPYAYGGVSRLTPGVPIQVFVEVVDHDTGVATRTVLFTGTADSWGQDWVTSPNRRVAQLVATDATKLFARMDRPEQPAVGAGDTTQQRVQRIVDFFGWVGTVEAGTGTVTLQATTLAQTAWELLNRTLDDELGYIYVTATGTLRWVGRATWNTRPAPTLELGCTTGHDILVDASPSALDRQMRNAVTAARTGGTTQSAVSQSSIDRYGRYEYSRTDLGLNDDTQTAVWATNVVQLYGYPQVALTDITMRPDVDPQPWKAWADVLKVKLISDVVHIVWSPPDLTPGYTVDSLSRVVGFFHQISRSSWEIKWQLVQTRPISSAGATFHMGPDARDRLDSNFVLAA